MLSWLGKKMIARNMAKAREGDIGPTLKMDAEDVKFRFPGDSSWGGEFNGKAELEPWLRRFRRPQAQRSWRSERRSNRTLSRCDLLAGRRIRIRPRGDR